MAAVTPIGPRIREREFQAAIDEAARERGWEPDPWRLRHPPAASRRRGREIRERAHGFARLRLVR